MSHKLKSSQRNIEDTLHDHLDVDNQEHESCPKEGDFLIIPPVDKRQRRWGRDCQEIGGLFLPRVLKSKEESHC